MLHTSICFKFNFFFVDFLVFEEASKKFRWFGSTDVCTAVGISLAASGASTQAEDKLSICDLSSASGFVCSECIVSCRDHLQQLLSVTFDDVEQLRAEFQWLTGVLEFTGLWCREKLMKMLAKPPRRLQVSVM